MNAPPDAPDRILRRFAEGQADETDVAWLRGRVASYLQAPDQGLEAALRLDWPWWRVERRRDELIRRLRAEHFAELSDWAAADAISTTTRRYLAAGWRIDRERGTPPAHPVTALLWAALRCNAGFPRSRRQLHTILRADAAD